MKTKLIILAFLLMGSNLLNAQTTPRGTSVTSCQTPEIWSYQDKLDWGTAYAISYPNATEQGTATTTSTYNCHSYAWNTTEGGPTCWIGCNSTTNEDIYWSDQSYIETSEAYASKISYYADDHSAIQTSTQGMYISKWGNKVLMLHANNDGPASYVMGYRKYYRLNPGINGISTALCENLERTFTSNTTISGSTYSWSRDNNLLDYVSGVGTTSYRVSANSGAGDAWLSLQITTPSGEVATTPNKNVWVGLPGMPTTNPSGYPTIQLNYGDFQLIRIASSPGAPTSACDWWSSGSITPSSSTSGSQCLFEATDYGSGNFYVESYNDCGISSTGGGAVNVSSGERGLGVLKISPNPATYEINVSVIDDKSDNTVLKNITSVRNDFNIEVIDNYGSTIFIGKMYEGMTKINTSGWKKGAYFVSVKNTTGTLTAKFLIK